MADLAQLAATIAAGMDLDGTSPKRVAEQSLAIARKIRMLTEDEYGENPIMTMASRVASSAITSHQTVITHKEAAIVARSAIRVSLELFSFFSHTPEFDSWAEAVEYDAVAQGHPEEKEEEER